MSLSRDPEKWRETRRKGVRRYRDRVRKEVLSGERDWNSLDGARKTRPAEETERIYGPPERRSWMKKQPSVVSGETPCVSAHVKDPNGPSGMGRKGDARWTVPLTYEEHEELHAAGQETFEANNGGIDLTRAARETHRRWLDYVAETGESDE